MKNNTANNNLTYTTYLKLPELFQLQEPVSNFKREELIFIVAHQAMELWIKVLIQEIEFFNSLCINGAEPTSLLQSLENTRCYWITLLAQFTGIAALTPIDFLKFRDQLMHASGAQSQQYKHLETILGVRQCGQTNTLHECTMSYLKHLSKGEGLQHNYKMNLTFRMLVDRLIEFDEFFARWKVEHLRLVRRMIGNKIGTGNSHQTLLAKKAEVHIFPALWALKDGL